MLSVVVPVFDSGPRLHRCLESLAGQTLDGLEVVLVDDGSRDGSADVARAFADKHDRARLVSQSHRGVGPARDAGVRVASGEYLAFCDSDDEVPPGAYERLVAALRQSGSDLAVGSVVLEDRGVFRQPEWARRSNHDRRLGASLDQVPEVMANLLPGTRVFRRSFWDRQRLTFGEDDHGDLVTMVRAVLAADALDVLVGVTYRWGRRESGSSLLQRDLREADRVRCKMAHVLEAGEHVLAEGSLEVQRQYFAGVLHTMAPELIQAAATRDDDYWSSLQVQLRRLMERVPDEDLETVPVGDRITAWLFARAERGVMEEFLEYAYDNPDGYPVQVVHGRPHVALPAIPGLPATEPAVTRVADVDLRHRTRLNAMRWVRPGVLLLEGAALTDYVESAEPGRVTVVLRERSSRAETEFPAVPVHDELVNRWASRAFEDHSDAAFRCEVDVAALGSFEDARTTYDVVVRLEREGRLREAGFQSRRTTGSAGLLESSTGDGVLATPVWEPARGLALRVEPVRDAAEQTDPGQTDPGQTDAGQTDPGRPMVTAVTTGADSVGFSSTADGPFELALVGRRSRTPWVASEPDGDGYRTTVSLLVDEWGSGLASLPTDDYVVTARTADGAETPVVVDPRLWRELPPFLDSGTHWLRPDVLADGSLQLRVAPGEHRDGGGPYVRRRLRDEQYPAARELPLLDAVLFETFAGRAAGDHPGALCQELARRETGLDLVFSVVDRSVRVPDGARSVVRWSAEWIELLGRARYLVTNAVLPPFFRKRPEQTFLHTWHGTPLKRIGHDRVHQDFPDWRHRRQLLEARHGWDHLVSQSPFCTEALRSAFLYDGDVLELGYPRNDVLLSPEADAIGRRTRERLGVPPDARVVLYAPTWRDNLRTGGVFEKVVYLDTAELVRQLPDTVVLVRGHYSSMGGAELRPEDRRIVDVTRYPDIADLYLAADALLTDYSSVFFDFAVTDKPMFFLAPDLEEYRDETRGFYLDYHETVPGPVAVTTQQVVDALVAPDRYGEARKRFRAEYAPWDDGHASERVVDVLLRGRASGA